jgi:hypothetical protein
LNIESTAYALTLKSVIIEACEEFVANLADENFANLKTKKGIDLVNELKDNYPNLKIFLNLNVRTILQRLGTEVFREINDDIHVMFKSIEVLSGMQSDKKTLLVIDDLRFPNELELILNLNNAKTNQEKIEVCLTVINKYNLEIDDDLIEEKFLSGFSITKAQLVLNEPLQKILSNIQKVVSEVRNKKEEIIDEVITVEYKAVEDFHLEKEKWSDILKNYGVIKIFRPLLPKDFKQGINNEEILIDNIYKYSGICKEYIKEIIIPAYILSKFSFDSESIIDHGFVRADASHTSETALKKYFSSFLVNYPKNMKEANEEILKFSQNLESFIANNTSNLTLIGLSGSAGNGKGYIFDIMSNVLKEKKAGNTKQKEISK